MTTEDALRELAASTVEAAVGILEAFLPGQVEHAELEIVQAGTSPMEGVSVPAVAADVSYVDGASGGAVFVTTITGVRKLAAAMMGGEAPAGSHPLDEMELSAVGEAMNQMMAAAADGTSRVLGAEVEISTPEVRDIETVAQAVALADGAPYSTRVSLTLAGEPCRLVQLIPKAYVLRMTRALDDLAAADLGGGHVGEDADAGPTDILRGVPLRVCAEIGRASMPMAEAVTLPAGGLVQLDRGADDPVDIMVNGRRFATGRLVLVDDEWAVRIEEVLLDASELPPYSPNSIERS